MKMFPAGVGQSPRSVSLYDLNMSLIK